MMNVQILNGILEQKEIDAGNVDIEMEKAYC